MLLAHILLNHYSQNLLTMVFGRILSPPLFYFAQLNDKKNGNYINSVRKNEAKDK